MSFPNPLESSERATDDARDSAPGASCDRTRWLQAGLLTSRIVTGLEQTQGEGGDANFEVEFLACDAARLDEFPAAPALASDLGGCPRCAN